MINLAVLHGFNGLRQVLDEYVIRPGRRVLAHTLIWSGAIVLDGARDLCDPDVPEGPGLHQRQRKRPAVARLCSAPERGLFAPADSPRAVRAARMLTP